VPVRLPKSVRSIHRLETIARVLSVHGFGHIVEKLGLEKYIPLPKRIRQPGIPDLETETESNLGYRLARVCEDLGPTFIKLGQILSTRPDLLPADMIAELAKLQDRVPPFDTEKARQIIADDLGLNTDEAFETFAESPFASGSIAQVYRATTRPTANRPSCRVVVKVKRPDIEDTTKLDMIILAWIAEVAERFVPELKAYQPAVIAEEFEQTLLREMDFINEAATVERFNEAMGEDANFRVPKVFWELTGPAVLTLEEMQGISLRTLLAGDDDGIDRKLLAHRLADGFVRQFFEIGLFHADPHPGNVLVEPPASMSLIDFGQTGRIDDIMLSQLVMALMGAIRREPEIVVEVLADMNALGEDTNRAQLRRAFLQLIEKYYGLPLHRFDMQRLFYEVTSLVRQNDVNLPREFVIFGKALVAVGGISLQLDPELDLIGLVKPRLRKLLLNRFSPKRMLRSAAVSGWHLLHLLKDAPGQLLDLSRRASRGRWQLTIRHQNLDHLANELDRASNRIGFAIIIGAIIMGSSWVLTSTSEAQVLGIPLRSIGVAGYLVAGVMGFWLLISIIRRGRLS
jgi:ubiquinone biosynthesis protein